MIEKVPFQAIRMQLAVGCYNRGCINRSLL